MFTEGSYTYTVFDGNATIVECDPSISGEITIPSTLGGYPVTDIGSGAFSDCDGMTGVTIPSGVTTIGDSAFGYCSSLTGITFDENSQLISIGDLAFTNCGSLTNITIPSGVITIGDHAFYYCGSLTNITIPSGVTTIGDSAFSYCSSLMDITIPSNVTAVGNSAFYNCVSLADVNFGKGSRLTTIGNWAFANCAVTNMILPVGVTRIGDSAFAECKGLRIIYIPASVTDIGDSVFWQCSYLNNVCYTGTQAQWDAIRIGSEQDDLLESNAIHFAEASGTYGENIMWELSDEGVLLITGNGDMIDDSNEKAPWRPLREIIKCVEIGEGVTSIGRYAFYCCSSLESVTIPSSITHIGDDAFAGCDSLIEVNITDIAAWCGIEFEGYREENAIFYSSGNPLGNGGKLYISGQLVEDLVIPDHVKSICGHAFTGCTSLKSVTIPSGVKTIGDCVFTECINLKRITIPSSVKTICEYAFYKCDSLEEVYYSGTQKQWDKIRIDWNNEALEEADLHLEVRD